MRKQHRDISFLSSRTHITGRLWPEQMRISAIDSHKRLVCPIFNNFALFDHYDSISHTHGRETMGNQQGCSSSSDMLKSTEDF